VNSHIKKRDCAKLPVGCRSTSGWLCWQFNGRFQQHQTQTIIF